MAMHCRSTTSRSGFPSRVRSSTAASAAGRESSTSFHRASNNDGSSGCSLAVLNTPSGPTLLTWTCATAHRDRRWSSSQKRRRITRDTRCGRPGRLMVRAFFQVGRRRAACLTRRRKAVSLPRMSRHPSGNREPNGSRLSSAVGPLGADRRAFTVSLVAIPMFLAGFALAPGGRFAR